jgi:hypothetical protein
MVAAVSRQMPALSSQNGLDHSGMKFAPQALSVMIVTEEGGIYPARGFSPAPRGAARAG